MTSRHELIQFKKLIIKNFYLTQKFTNETEAEFTKKNNPIIINNKKNINELKNVIETEVDIEALNKKNFNLSKLVLDNYRLFLSNQQLNSKEKLIKTGLDHELEILIERNNIISLVISNIINDNDDFTYVNEMFEKLINFLQSLKITSQNNDQIKLMKMFYDNKNYRLLNNYLQNDLYNIRLENLITNPTSLNKCIFIIDSIIYFLKSYYSFNNISSNI